MPLTEAQVVSVPFCIKLAGFSAGTVELRRNSQLGSKGTQKVILSQLRSVLGADLTNVNLRARSSSSGSEADINAFKTTSVDTFVEESGSLIVDLGPPLQLGKHWEVQGKELMTSVKRLEAEVQQLKAADRQHVAEIQQHEAEIQQHEAEIQQHEAEIQQLNAADRQREREFQQLRTRVDVLQAGVDSFSSILRRSLVDDAHEKLQHLPDGIGLRHDDELWIDYIERILDERGLTWARNKRLSMQSLFLLPKGAGTPYQEGSDAAHSLRLNDRSLFDASYLSGLSAAEVGPWRELYDFVSRQD